METERLETTPRGGAGDLKESRLSSLWITCMFQSCKWTSTASCAGILSLVSWFLKRVPCNALPVPPGKDRSFMSPGSWSSITYWSMFLFLQLASDMMWAVLWPTFSSSQAAQPPRAPLVQCWSPMIAAAALAFTCSLLQFPRVSHSTCPNGLPSNTGN